MNNDALRPASWPTGVSGDETKRLWIQLFRLLAHMSRLKVSSVVVVPVSESSSARAFTLELGAAGTYRGNQVRIIGAEGLSHADAQKVAEEIPSHLAAGLMVIASVDPILQSDTGMPIVFATEAAIVVVPLGAVHVEAVRTTLDIIGRDRVLGCVAVRGG